MNGDTFVKHGIRYPNPKPAIRPVRMGGNFSWEEIFYEKRGNFERKRF